MGDTPDDEATTELKKNAWDDYLATKQQMVRDVHGRMVYKSPDDDMCFDVYAARQETVCPVWTFWRTRAVWALDSTEGELYCHDSLTHFKPPVRALADVKGEHATTYSASMLVFLDHQHCPAGLQRQVARARLAVVYETHWGWRWCCFVRWCA